MEDKRQTLSDIFGSIPEVPSTFYFEIWSLTGLEFIKKARLVGQRANSMPPRVLLSLLPQYWDYRPALPYQSFFIFNKGFGY